LEKVKNEKLLIR